MHLKAEKSKEIGNECVRDGKYTEAMLHYTEALKHNPRNHQIYSNRSLAFLKMGQFWYALQDAKESIRLQPRWAKGYFRKGEVEFQTENYEDAFMSYQQAQFLQPEDEGITSAIAKTKAKLYSARRGQAWQPYIGAGSGLLLGFLIVCGDCYITKKPTINNWISRMALAFLFGGLGLLASKAYRYIKSTQSSGLLDPPVDLLGSDDTTRPHDDNIGMATTPNNPVASRNHCWNPETRATKEKFNDTNCSGKKGGLASARQRYRKGKT